MDLYFPQSIEILLLSVHFSEVDHFEPFSLLRAFSLLREELHISDITILVDIGQSVRTCLRMYSMTSRKL